jgi:hypothetical protein
MVVVDGCEWDEVWGKLLKEQAFELDKEKGEGFDNWCVLFH